MSTTTASTAMASATRTAPRRNALWQLTAIELKLLVRERMRLVFGVALPLILLVIFGAIPSFNKASDTFHGETTLDVYVPILVAFSGALLALTGLPQTLADYRERGVLRRLRTTPAGPSRVLAAQLIVNLGIALVTAVVLLVVGRLGYGVPLPKQVGGFVLAVVLTYLALMGIGLFIASVAPSAKTAQNAGQILFYPMMFFAGLWMPIAAMPKALQHLSHAMPLGAAVQALQDASQGDWPHGMQILTLVAWAVVLLGASAKLFRWE
ncbi:MULTISPECIES: ABC transporter permease [Streptomycetaceae]|uniref:ABC transporter permease n=1 Tax=Streptomycetaceae TaxID=2062 RepID=UPI003009BA75